MQTIETFIPITKAKAKLLEMVRQLGGHKRHDSHHKNGVPEAVMLSMRKLEGLLETIDILADSELMKQITASSKDVDDGRLIDLDKAF